MSRKISAYAWAAALALSSAAMPPAQAQHRPSGLPNHYPNKPVNVVVGAPAGGGTDIVARLVMSKLSERWNRSFVIKNRVSIMGSVMALDYVSKQPADGYTLDVVSGSTYLNAALVSRVPKNVMTALDPVAQFTSTPFVLVVAGKSSSLKSISDLVDYARKNPGKLSYASSGLGGSAHLAGEYLKHQLKLSILHVPYQGIGQGYADLAAGRVHLAFGTTTSAMPRVRKGSLKLLATTKAKRLPGLQDVPALSEIIPDFEYVSFSGTVAPAGVPEPIIHALNKGLNETLMLPEVRKRLVADGAIVTPATPEDFRKAIEAFIGRAQQLIKEAKLDLRSNQ